MVGHQGMEKAKAMEFPGRKQFEADVEQLRFYLEIMHAGLRETEKVEGRSADMRARMKEARELSYDVEDFIDEAMLRPSREPRDQPGCIKGFIIRSSRKWKKLQAENIEFAQQMGRLKKRIQQLSRDVVRGHPWPPAHHGQAPDVVGMDGLRDELIGWLAQGESGSAGQLRVVSIVGREGSGKTDLASEVYHRLVEKFSCRAFVSASQKPDLNKILRDILSQVMQEDQSGIEACDDENMESPSDDQLITTLKELLQDKRYFITIDDLWSKETWKDIKCALPENNHGSLIITATHINAVAEFSCSSHEGFVYELKPLNEKGDGETSLPSHSKEHFEQILEELPYHLKTSLLYLSMLPDEYTIAKDRLVWRWIAEGFVHEEHGRRVEKTGESYFNELIYRNVVQPITFAYDGQPMDCRVYNMVLSLIASESNQENFANLCFTTEFTSLPDDTVRHLSIHYGDQQCATVPKTIVLSRLRSLTIFGCAERMPSLLECTALRVLDLEDSEELEDHHLKNIGRLIHLRYLGLKGTNISELPEQIGELKNLQTLDLSWTRVRELPGSIIQLRHLARLLVEYVKVPDWIGEMGALQELSMIQVSSSCSIKSVIQLGHLSNLRTLGVSWFISDTHEDVATYKNTLVSSLSQLCTKKLRSLCFGSDGTLDFLPEFLSAPYTLRKVELDGYYYARVPKWIAPLQKLAYLDISIDQVREEDFQVLGELQALLLLRLCLVTTPKKRVAVGNKGFHCLKEFKFICWHGMGMVFEAGAMPKLEMLDLLFDAAETESSYGGFDFGVELPRSLNHVHVKIGCQGAKRSHVEAAEAAVRSAAKSPLSPRVVIIRLAESQMIRG